MDKSEDRRCLEVSANLGIKWSPKKESKERRSLTLCMGCRRILLKPHTQNRHMLLSHFKSKIVYRFDVTFRVYSNSIFIFVFKKVDNWRHFSYQHTKQSFWVALWSLVQFSQILKSQITVLLIHHSSTIKISFIAHWQNVVAICLQILFHLTSELSRFLYPDSFNCCQITNLCK